MRLCTRVRYIGQTKHSNHSPHTWSTIINNSTKKGKNTSPKYNVQGQSTADAITAIEKRLAEMAAPVGGKGLIPITLRLTVSKDAHTNKHLMPKQCQLVINYLTALGGSATIAEINKLAEVAKGAQAWGRNDGQPYEQTPQKIIGHYMAKLTGSADWSKSKGRVKALSA